MEILEQVLRDGYYHEPWFHGQGQKYPGGYYEVMKKIPTLTSELIEFKSGFMIPFEWNGNKFIYHSMVEGSHVSIFTESYYRENWDNLPEELQYCLFA